MKRVFALCCAVLVICLLTGCTETKKAQTKVFDPQYDPDLHIEHYKLLNDLIGTERMAALASLGYELSDTTFEHWWDIEIPMKAEINGVSFSVHLDFENKKTDDGERLESFYYQKLYDYEQEKDAAVREIMAVCRELNEHLGKPDAVDSWNDWLEEESGEELDQEIPAWKSEEQLRQILDNESWGGVIMSWDVTGYCSEGYKQFVESNGWEMYDAIHVSVGRFGDQIWFVIYF